MNNKICPNCSTEGISKKEKFLHSLFGKAIRCNNCGVNLKIHYGLIKHVVVVFIGQLIFFPVFISAFFLWSFPILVGGVFAIIVFGILATYLGSFERIGTKQFKLE